MKAFLIVGLSAAVLAAGAAMAGGGRHGGGWGAKSMDQNSDGNVSKAEVVSASLAEVTAMDMDRDGSISAADMRAFREAKRAEREAAHLAKLDTDKNGRVSIAELAAQRTERVMRRDRNGDGVLSAEELQHRGHRGHGSR